MNDKNTTYKEHLFDILEHAVLLNIYQLHQGLVERSYTDETAKEHLEYIIQKEMTMLDKLENDYRTYSRTEKAEYLNKYVEAVKHIIAEHSAILMLGKE